MGHAPTLQDDGYCVVEGLIDGDTVARIRAELTRLFDATPFGRDDFEGHRTRRVRWPSKSSRPYGVCS